VTAAASGIPGATRCWPVYVQAKRYTGRYVGRILTKLGLRDRVQVVVLAYESGLVRPGGS